MGIKLFSLALLVLISCASGFVAQVPARTSKNFVEKSNAIVGRGNRVCRRHGTALWGRKLTPDQREERDQLLREEEEEELEALRTEKSKQDEERRKYQSAGEERRLQERQQLEQEEEPVAVNYWGTRRSLEIGEDRIRYNAYKGELAPAVLYLPAFDAPSDDLKATTIRSYCEEEDYPFISMEWYGVGSSTGNFADGTISRWKQDAITLIDKLLPDKGQKTVIVGGGVGGWIATLIALERPEKVAGIVGLAADPDFTENLLMRYLPKQKIKEIFDKGVATISWGRASYPVSRKLIEDARDNLVLEGAVGDLPIYCPVRLVHGLDDEEVPYTVSLDLSRRLASDNVNLYLVKTANHHLDGMSILNLVISALQEVMDAYVPPSPYFTNPNL